MLGACWRVRGAMPDEKQHLQSSAAPVQDTAYNMHYLHFRLLLCVPAANRDC